MASSDERAARERARETHADVRNLVWFLVEAKLLELTLAGVVFDCILALVSDDEGASDRSEVGSTRSELSFGSTSSVGLGGRDTQQPDDLRRTVETLKERLVETGYINNRHLNDSRTASALPWIQQATLEQQEVALQRRFSSAITALLDAGRDLAAPGPKDPSLLHALGKAIANLLNLSAARLRLDAARTAAKVEAEPTVPATVRVESEPIVPATRTREEASTFATTLAEDPYRALTMPETEVVSSSNDREAVVVVERIAAGRTVKPAGEEDWLPGISPSR